MNEISDPLMEFDEGGLFLNDIEASASAMSGGISSAKYEEPISIENQKRVFMIWSFLNFSYRLLFE